MFSVLTFIYNFNALILRKHPFAIELRNTRAQRIFFESRKVTHVLFFLSSPFFRSATSCHFIHDH